MKEKVQELKAIESKIFEGGGKKAAAKQKEKGKMLARERVDYLLDKDAPRIEIGHSGRL
jgi:3-methylcrotonyl-CoA carboxylase beta subunit